GPQKGAAVVLLPYSEVNGCVYDVHDIRKQLAAHVPRERSERSSLTSVCPVINDQHGFRRIRITIRIAERGVCLHRGHDTEAVKLHAIPSPRTNVPRQDGFITGKPHLTIGEALAGIDIGAAALDVVAGDLRFRGSTEKKCKRDRENG